MADRLFKKLRKNKDNFNTFWHARNTRRNNLFHFTESKFLTTAGSKHSFNYGLKLYNNFIYQFPELEHNNILKFKLKIKEILRKNYFNK